MESEEKWVIDIDWLENNGRSFSVMVMDYLCPKCRKKMKADQKELEPDDIIKNIKTCCSKSDEFISPALPLQESVFRVMLASGNKALTPMEISRDLDIRRGVDVLPTSVKMLTRLLQSDRHYGFKVVN